MESNVVFPEPDGPSIDTNSPRITSRCAPERAWVSTSSVVKILVMPSRRINASVTCSSFISLQPDAIDLRPRRRVGHDDGVARGEAARDLDVLHRHAPEANGDAHRLVAGDAEHRRAGVGLQRRRARDVEGVGDLLDLHPAVDA